MSSATSLLKLSIVVTLITNSFLLADGISRYGIVTGQGVAETMAQAYTRSMAAASEFTAVNRAVQVFTYCYAFQFIAMTLGLYRFRELSMAYRVLLIGIYVAFVSYTVLFVGAQKNIGDLCVIFGSVFLIKLARRERRLKARHIALILAAATGVVYALSNAFSARIALWGIDVDQPWDMVHLDRDHWMLRLFPKDLALGLAIALYYPTHGYYGLSLCLGLPFVWTAGLGSSFVIRDLATRYLGMGSLVAGLTYPERMQSATGWAAYSNWHTIFPWLASDLTFFGAIIAVSLLVYVYAVSWKEALCGDNWLSVLMFSCLNTMLVYVPCNNQLAQTKPSLLTFVVLVTLWGFLHKRYNRRPLTEIERNDPRSEDDGVGGHRLSQSTHRERTEHV